MLKPKLIPIYKQVVTDLSKTSTCDRAKVGAIMIDDGRIVSSGYNGSIEGAPSCDMIGHLLVDGHCIRTLHAEMNVILSCAKRGVAVGGCDIITSHFPCVICTKMLLQSGIQHIYYVNDYRNDDNYFKGDSRISKL